MVTFSRVPLQNLCPAALWTIQYVGPLQQAPYSTLLHRFAALSLLPLCAVVPAPSATVIILAVLTAKSPAKIPRVRIPIYLFFRALDLLARLLSWRYVGSHRQLLT